MPTKKKDPRITKRRVTMTNTEPFHQAVDYVLPEVLDAYVKDASTRWQQVTVSDEPDAGPGGYDGETYYPAYLDHPLAGTTVPATKE